ncbi:phosphoinositide-3-kinase-interacting protein 1 [Bombina bombina]|uniref:phosphoinositide-3-kinase-interacting protein 1 n=1 Tax=Bombina bombina TaxID=8345 RepID=UPI00235A9B9B|nr:phosphoinositide-3-kinase-interacting protein 1 [Bombina bombina]
MLPGVKMHLQALFVLLIGQLLTETLGTPAPSDYPTADLTPSMQKAEETTDLVPFYKEPVAPVQSPDNSRVAQPVISISERVQVKPREKKDLGTLGYVVGILMVVIIIAIGSGIMVGYIYKRGRDLKQRHEQELKEQRLHRINLPLSAFMNPTCDIVDENSIEVPINHTPNTAQEGNAPLMGCAGTPGA